MPFPEPETAVASTIVRGGGDYLASDRFRVLGGTEGRSYDFSTTCTESQRLTRDH